MRAIEEMSVAEIMRRWPPTIGVFIANDMHCIGCPIAIFHTLADAALEHHLAVAPLTASIRQAILRSKQAGR